MANPLKCFAGKFNFNWRKNGEINCLHVIRQTILDEDVILTLGNNSLDAGIRFVECIIFAIPTSISIRKFIPNLTVLAVNNSKLSKITSEDLKGYDCLRDLYIEFCEIDYLPGDLFKHTPNLEIVSFHDNKIKYIDEGILDPLRNLRIFSLLKNTSINVKYDVKFDASCNGGNVWNVTLAQLKNEIMTKCTPPWMNNVQNSKLKRICDKQEKEITMLKTKQEHLEKKLEALYQKFCVINEVSKDFTIKVKSKLFSVHKAVLITHSEVLARFIAENPDAESVELEDISEATFQDILNYMNEGSSLSEAANMIHLLEASCRLEIKALIKIAVECLKEEVNHENALDVLVLCNKIGKLKLYDELKMKAFAEFQKNFPHQKLMPELASQSKKLQMLMEAKVEMDEMVAKIQII